MHTAVTIHYSHDEDFVQSSWWRLYDTCSCSSHRWLCEDVWSVLQCFCLLCTGPSAVKTKHPLTAHQTNCSDCSPCRKGCLVVANDLNPAAILFAQQNAKLYLALFSILFGIFWTFWLVSYCFNLFHLECPILESLRMPYPPYPSFESGTNST